MSTKAEPKAAKAVASPAVDEDLISNAPSDWEFETVTEESPTLVEFDTIGDIFIGQYVGVEHIDPKNEKDEPFDRFNFRGRDGDLYALNQSYKLEMAMEKIEPGQWVRVTYIKDIPTGRKLNPMKDFRVDVKK